MIFSAFTAWAQETASDVVFPVQTPGTALSSGAAAVSSVGSTPQWMNFVFMGAIAVFMWFFIIRPQNRRQKEHKIFLESLQPGVEIVTSGGLIGKVTHVDPAIVTLDIGQHQVRVQKSAISGRWTPTPPPSVQKV